MNNILCSILIPVYNGEEFLEKTIKSCLAQSLIDNIEIIVIDDCSNDSSFEIMQKLASSYPSIIALKNDINSGINKTVNKAASLGKGKYIMFLGHDDMLRANHIEVIINEFDDETSFVHCNADLIDKDDNIFGVGVDDTVQTKKTKNIKYYLSSGNVVHSTGAIIRKSSFENVGGWDEQFRNYGEWLLWIKLSSVGQVKYSTQIKALYRRHDTNITNSFEDKNVKPELFEYYQLCQNTAISKIDNIFIRYFINAVKVVKNIIKIIKSQIKGMLKYANIYNKVN
jgi:glycosyltransferase involved in cell wall biosynthesis